MTHLVDPTESKAIGAGAGSSVGIDMLDAPVSGGEPKVIDGTLSVMVGGKKRIAGQAQDTLMVMAGSVVRRRAGFGATWAKLANQIVLL